MAINPRPEEQRRASPRPRTETHPTAGHPAEPLAAPFMRFDLAAEAARLQGEPAYARTGRNAVTLAKYADLRLVLTAVRGGTRIDGHHAEGPVSIHTLSGSLRLHVGGESVELSVGGLVALDAGVAHDVEATKDSVFLLEVAATRKQV